MSKSIDEEELSDIEDIKRLINFDERMAKKIAERYPAFDPIKGKESVNNAVNPIIEEYVKSGGSGGAKFRTDTELK